MQYICWIFIFKIFIIFLSTSLKLNLFFALCFRKCCLHIRGDVSYPFLAFYSVCSFLHASYLVLLSFKTSLESEEESCRTFSSSLNNSFILVITMNSSANQLQSYSCHGDIQTIMTIKCDTFFPLPTEMLLLVWWCCLSALSIWNYPGNIERHRVKDNWQTGLWWRGKVHEKLPSFLLSPKHLCFG